MAAGVSTRRRQEGDFRRDGPAGQSQLAAISGEARSRARRVTVDPLLPVAIFWLSGRSTQEAVVRGSGREIRATG